MHGRFGYLYMGVYVWQCIVWPWGLGHSRSIKIGRPFVVGYFWCGSRAALYRRLQQGLLLPVFLVRVKAQNSERFALGFISYGRSSTVRHLWSVNRSSNIHGRSSIVASSLSFM